MAIRTVSASRAVPETISPMTVSLIAFVSDTPGSRGVIAPIIMHPRFPMPEIPVARAAMSAIIAEPMKVTVNG